MALILGLLLASLSSIAWAESNDGSGGQIISQIVGERAPAGAPLATPNEQLRLGPTLLAAPLPQPQVALDPPDPLHPGVGDYVPDATATASPNRFDLPMDLGMTAQARNPLEHRGATLDPQLHVVSPANSLLVTVGASRVAAWRLGSFATTNICRQGIYETLLLDRGMTVPVQVASTFNVK